MSTLAQRVSAPEPQFQQPQAPQAPENLDPEVRKWMEWQTSQIQNQTRQQQALFASQLGDQQLNASLPSEHALVQQRAKFIWEDAKAKGAHLNGYTPAMAINYARGELYPQIVADLQKNQQAAQTVQTAQRMAQASIPVTAQSHQATAGVPQQNQPVPDLDEDPEAASNFYLARLGDKAF